MSPILFSPLLCLLADSFEFGVSWSLEKEDSSSSLIEGCRCLVCCWRNPFWMIGPPVRAAAIAGKASCRDLTIKAMSFWLLVWLSVMATFNQVIASSIALVFRRTPLTMSTRAETCCWLSAVRWSRTRKYETDWVTFL